MSETANTEYESCSGEKLYEELFGALSNIYTSMSRIDLETQTMQRMITHDEVKYVYGAKTDAKETLKRLIYKYVEDGYIPAMLTFTDVDTIDARLGNQKVIVQEYVGRDGQWKRCFIIPVRRDENGKNISVIYATRLITREIEALEAQDNMIQGLAIPYENVYVVNGVTGDTICYRMGQTIHDRYGNKFATANYEDSLRVYSENDVVPEDRCLFEKVRFLSGVNELLSEQKTYSFQYRVLRKGKIQYFHCQLVKPTQERNEFVIAFRNVTEEKEKVIEQERILEEALEAAEIANKAKSTFLFNMSHDIRTPLNAISGYTELILKNPENIEKCIDYAHKIQSSNEFLLSLINNVLEMARIESNRMVLDESPIQTGQVVNEVGAVYSELMKEKRIDFTYSVEAQTKYIFVDKVKLKEIFLNLVSNAYKYTPEGGKIVFTRREIPCDREGYALLETVVSDTGIGMSKEYLTHLYDEFSRERNSTERGIQGTGLGMPIVKSMVELMGGTIQVESELGKGTTFIVTIPHRIASVQDVNKENAVEVDVAQFKGKRVLLAEDNNLNAEIAMEILKSKNFIVERAEDGIICVDMLQKADNDYYDLIIMDIQMPNMNGYKATKMIRSMEDQKSKIPIVAMTANAFEEDKKEAFAVGMNGHIAKPINVNKMMETIAYVLNNTDK